MEHDTCLSSIVATEPLQLRKVISSVPGVVQLVPDVSPTSHMISKFVPAIADTKVPKRFQTPNLKPYDGTTDPEEHVAQYRGRMEIIPIPTHVKEAYLFQGFSFHTHRIRSKIAP